MKRIGKVALCLGLSFGMFATEQVTPLKIEAKKKTKLYQIGQTAQVKGMKITVNSIREIGATALESPEEGKTFIAVDCTLENTTNEDHSSSSMMWYSMKSQDGRKCDQVLTAELNGSLDTEILSGETVAGEIAYEVPTEGSLYFTYKPSFGKGSVRIQVR